MSSSVCNPELERVGSVWPSLTECLQYRGERGLVGQVEQRLRLFRIGAVRDVDGRADRYRRIGRPEAERERALLRLFAFEECEKSFGRLALLGAHPRGVEDRMRMIGP